MSFEYNKRSKPNHSSRPVTAEGATAASAARHTRMQSSQQFLQLQQTAGNQAALQMYRGQALQRQSSDDSAASVRNSSASKAGNRLPDNVATKMQNSLQVDTSNVNIHQNSSSATNVGALAYTQGNDIHFAPGQYNPESSQGQELIGHELTHVVQQRAGRVKPTTEIAGHQVNDDPKLEREADSMGKRAAASSGPLQRSATSSSSTKSSAASSSKTPIQRLPTRRQMEKELDPKAGFFNSTRVKGFLKILDRFNHFVDQTLVGRNSDIIKKQTVTLKALYGEVEQSANAYINSKEEGDKLDSMKQFVERLKRERALLLLKAQDFISNPPPFPPKWYIVMTSLRGMSATKTYDRQKTGESGSGALNSVDFLNLGDRKAVFKTDKQQIKEVPEDQGSNTEFNVASDMAGINTEDAHMAARNVAAFRLDKWLGANVIAHAEFALHQSGSGDFKSGSIMDAAKGKQAAAVGGKLDFNDPVLQRSLSRLQLMDALSMQVDRHAGNYFVQTEEKWVWEKVTNDEGKVNWNYTSKTKVLGVTGIDNDMAFGERNTNVNRPRQEYPGLSKFVDKELAERILGLQDDDLIFLVADLLSSAEIQALLTRLHSLQTHLKKLQGDNKLLGKNDWNASTSEQLSDEKTSYLNTYKFHNQKK